MTRPEDALAHARAEAARKRATGDYPKAGAAALDGSIVSARPSIELLSDWAVIEGDPELLLYSTRRAGAPVTALKRMIARLLRQYAVEVEARQTRFNIALLANVQELERRIGALERAAQGRAADSGRAGPAAGPSATPARPAATREEPRGSSADPLA